MIDFIFGILLGGILGVLFLGVWIHNRKMDDDECGRDYDEE